MKRVLSLIILTLVLTGCSEEHRQTQPLRQCLDCHAVELDGQHQLPCTSCHQGDNAAKDKGSAHAQLIAHPSHPDSMQKVCGPCHGQMVAEVLGSTHFTLENSTNLFREAFGATEKLTSFLDTPRPTAPATALDLADDLLRRRCFKCHPYSQGDDYPATTHGTGCASCHLAFAEGRLTSHKFEKPRDEQCLSCHYGNYVGFDYYGRFEHDFNAEYRTPFTTRNSHFRPYGVEYHPLVADIHQQRGMVCLDCHSGKELMGKAGGKPSCRGCHENSKLTANLPDRVEKRSDGFILYGVDGKEHPIPLLQHPAHFEQPQAITCQACHAQWTFNDFGKHFLRSDSDDLSPWSLLATQGNAELEAVVENNINFDKPELPPDMTDTLSGKSQPGLWFKGYSLRRWETPLLGRDESGAIATVRPLLDWSLSWIDQDETIRFDSVTPQHPGKILHSYVPHTTGPAGVFYRLRIDQFLETEQLSAPR